ncbi:PKD domain-containing protein [Paraferrimonas haliotis]|uniref:PKD/Chitinase domain-containing protein n=1 Tax=Paraferrimonas haliotis TaxID=2013866 RepID=A0AA37TP09_9GAMM|nr:PKD domain-containing protein [Paraferrimonas haliotis]GLS83010.1 hypothetical protein GCM10007894_09870 [Paraferrimonas haliotis]
MNIEISRKAKAAAMFVLMSLAVGCNSDDVKEELGIPTANAGDDAQYYIKDTIMLDGSASNSSDGEQTLIYDWRVLTQPDGSDVQIQDADMQMASFKADKPGVYVVELLVKEDGLDSLPDVVEIRVTGIFASAGTNQSVKVGEAIVLDGSHSTDASRSASLSYQWVVDNKPDNSQSAIQNADQMTASFVPDVAGAYSFELTVSDSAGDSARAEIVASVAMADTNSAPIAHAGSDINVLVGQVAQLDASASNDPDSMDNLTYQWSEISAPDGSIATISSATGIVPTFTPDVAGVYVFELVVNDGTVDSTADQVSILAKDMDHAPVAQISAPANAPLGANPIQLDGSASSDPDGDALSYSWHLRPPAGSALNSVLPNDPAVSFIPDVAGQYVVELIVNDGQKDSAHSTATINIAANPPAMVNNPPSAVVPVNFSIAQGMTVVLDGTRSSDPDAQPITFSWSFVSKPSGSSATFADNPPANPKASYVNLSSVTFVGDVPGDYKVKLTVSDGELSDSTQMVVSVNPVNTNTQPVANAGDDKLNVVTGSAVHIASASTDADGDTLTYQWSLKSKPNSSTATVTSTANAFDFTPDVEGQYVIELVVNDGQVDSAPDTVVIGAKAPVNAPSKQQQLMGLGLDAADAAYLAQNHPQEVDFVLNNNDRLFKNVPELKDSWFKAPTDPIAGRFNNPTNWSEATKTRFKKMYGRIVFGANTQEFQQSFDRHANLLDQKFAIDASSPAFPGVAFPGSFAQFKSYVNQYIETEKDFSFVLSSDRTGFAYGVIGLNLAVEENMVSANSEINGFAPLVFHELTHSFGYLHLGNDEQTTFLPNNIPYFVQIILGREAGNIPKFWCNKYGIETACRPETAADKQRPPTEQFLKETGVTRVTGDPNSVLTHLFGSPTP